MDYKYLGKINSPAELKKLNIEQLGVLCAEIRDDILNTVSKNGGHLASNLGAVELTVALHYVFDAPNDSIVFDVGHQCYTHKLLTGRYEQFSTLRKENGISGFLRPDESEYDLFVSGHSSTAISSAFGLLKGKRIQGDSGKVIAVVGDGAMTGGMVYEAMNNAGRDKNNLIIVLNDNRMSISKNVGAFSRYLGVIRQRQSYFNFKREAKNVLSHIPVVGPYLRSKISVSKDMLKHRLFYNSNIFEGFGFKYFGPTDGHDLSKLINMFNEIKKESRPVVLHVTTIKGKGYPFAEKSPDLYHGVSSFDLGLGVSTIKKTDFSSVFGDTLVSLAEKNGKICAVTAAMPEGTGLNGFAKKFPKRFFDVGIAEQHALTFTVGLAKSGLKPFFAVYSSFFQRSVDQLIHDAAISKADVTICLDRAGFVGADGETHQGLFDIPLVTSVPGVTVYSPANYKELTEVMNICAENGGVKIIRYPRGGESTAISDISYEGDYSVFGNSSKVAVTYGAEFADIYSPDADYETVKLNKVFPISEALMDELINKEKICVFEESNQCGGIGEKLGCALCEKGFKGEFNVVAVNGFVASATVESDKKKFGLDFESVKKIMEK